MRTAMAATREATPRGEVRRPRWRRWGRLTLITLLIVLLLLTVARAAMEPAVAWYVNRTIDRDPRYDGEIGGVDIHLWRGAYAVRDVRLNKVTGNVVAPLFRSPRVDFSLQWSALLAGAAVGQIQMDRPELNFVDGGAQGGIQTGAGGPWLDILQDLFPFKINRVTIRDGAIHFRADRDPAPVDVYLSQVEATVDDLSNIRGDVTPLVTTVHAWGMAMDQAQMELHMRLDPFSYRPTFHLTTRLLNLDVTQLNDLARAYGGFDFEHGWFDLVVEVHASEGRLRGYAKPLFRDLAILSAARDVPEDNPLQLAWEAAVGLTGEVLQNQPRDQLGTLIEFSGDMTSPRTSLLEIVGNVLRNAFIRAYLPRLEDGAGEAGWSSRRRGLKTRCR